MLLILFIPLWIHRHWPFSAVISDMLLWACSWMCLHLLQNNVQFCLECSFSGLATKSGLCTQLLVGVTTDRYQISLIKRYKQKKRISATNQKWASSPSVLNKPMSRSTGSEVTFPWRHTWSRKDAIKWDTRKRGMTSGPFFSDGICWREREKNICRVMWKCPGYWQVLLIAAQLSIASTEAAARDGPGWWFVDINLFAIRFLTAGCY